MKASFGNPVAKSVIENYKPNIVIASDDNASKTLKQYMKILGEMIIWTVHSRIQSAV